MPDGRTARLIAVILDDRSSGRAPPEIEHERRVAVYDLVEDSSFAVEGHQGPYRLVISLVDRRLIFDVRSEANRRLVAHALSLTPFRKIVKDYFLVCESYRLAIRTGSPSRIEAIDMGRRGLHDEAAQVLLDRLKGKISVDAGTARRLFTLICALHWRG